MNFDLSEEQTLLQDGLARFLRERYSFAARRKMIEQGAGFNSNIWQDFSHTLGILGASLPECFGGLGGGAVETMMIMEALGQALLIEPYLETV